MLDLRIGGCTAPPSGPDPVPIRAGWEAGAGRGTVSIEGVGRFVLSRRDHRVVAHPYSGVTPATVRDAFLATVLPLALQARGRQLLHASAVDTARGLVALCGGSGVGKSTLAAGLARRGFPQWSDDSVLLADDLGRGGEGPVDCLHLPFRPRLQPDVRGRWEEGEAPPRLVLAPGARRPLRCVLVLCRGEVPAVRPVALGAEALPVLLDNAYRFPGPSETTHALVLAFLDLVARVPVRRLLVPDDLDRLDRTLDEVADVIRDAAEGVGAAPG